MLFTKLALVTCAFYLGFAALLDSIQLIAAVKTSGFFVYSSRIGWLGFFALVWIISFLVSWRLVITPLLTRTA